MRFPLVSEYIDAVLMAEDNFATLTQLRPVLDHEGNPIMSSGNFAVVFKMRDERTKKEYAVKCFTKDQERRSASYKRISDFLKGISSQYLVNFQYCEDELFVDTSVSSNDMYPIVLMDWVSGINLTNYINNILDNKQELYSLLLEFKNFLIWMLEQPFAHGDLKPDNILINQAGKIVLVDYDGMYVPSMHGEKAREYGSPDFRNPNKEFEDFDEDMDVFSLISIYLSLSLIAYDSANLMKFASSERLLFSVNDYYDLQNCDIYRYIQNTFSNDGKTRKMVEILKALCEGMKSRSSVIEEIRQVVTYKVSSAKSEYTILPAPEVYIDAIRNYTINLNNIKDLEPIIVKDRPVHIMGANSIVFKMYDRMSRKYYALKCYTNITRKIYDRLKTISKKNQEYESQYIVKFQVIDDALYTDGYGIIIGENSASYPAVLMDWIEGKTLFDYINNNYKLPSKEEFEEVKRNFFKMSRWLLEQNFSHGDLSPHNILVTSDNQIKLIDYDNMVFKGENKPANYINKLKDKDFCNPYIETSRYEDNVDSFALVSLCISIRYKFAHTYPKLVYILYSCFFTKEDYKDIENCKFFKKSNWPYSYDFGYGSIAFCLKQQLRSVKFTKEEILYLFKHDLNPDTICYRVNQGQNEKLGKTLSNYASACSVIAFFVPFVLITCTQLNLLGVSLLMLVSSVVWYLILFIVASFRPDKPSRLRLKSGDDYLPFGCLGYLAMFIPVLLMADFVTDFINQKLSWINIPSYNEPWYITVLIWMSFVFTGQIIAYSISEDIYDYDTLMFDLRNRNYIKKRERFISKLHEDEYNYKYSKEFKDSRLYKLVVVNLIVLLGMIYALYRFFVLHDDLIMTNVIISVLTCCGILLVKPILKDKYSTYSNKAKHRYRLSMVAKVFLPLITIPFAFSGITNYLNGLFGSSFPPYDLGLKELIINTVLYLIIFYTPMLKEEYL